MSEEPPQDNNGNSITIPTPFGKAKITGGFVIFFVLNLGAAWFFYDFMIKQNLDRAKEHDEINGSIKYLNCRITLDIWIHENALGQPLEFHKMPNELWTCLP